MLFQLQVTRLNQQKNSLNVGGGGLFSSVFRCCFGEKESNAMPLSTEASLVVNRHKSEKEYVPQFEKFSPRVAA